MMISLVHIIFDRQCVLCVRWNPNGEQIASSSKDKMAKVLDFGTGKVLYSSKTFDGNIVLDNYFRYKFSILASVSSICFI